MTEEGKSPTRRALLARNAILAVVDQQTEDVDVPEWDGVVRLRTLTAAEAIKFSEGVRKGEENAAIRILLLSAVNEDGTPLFLDEDIPELKKKSMKVMLRLQRAALRLNGLSGGELTEAKNVSSEAKPGASPTA